MPILLFMPRKLVVSVLLNETGFNAQRHCTWDIATHLALLAMLMPCMSALGHRAPTAACAVGDMARSTADAAELQAAAGPALISEWDPSVRAGVPASRAASERSGSQAAACAGSALRSCPALHHVHSRRSVAALLGSMKLQAQG